MQAPHLERRLFVYLKPNLRTLAIGLICAAATSGITSSFAIFIKHTIDAMLDGSVGHLNFMCAAVVVVFIFKGIFTFGQNYYLSLTANRVGASLRDDIYAHLHTLSLSFFNRKRTGAIMSTITNDVQVIQNAAQSLKDTVSAPIMIVIALSALFYVSPHMAFASVLFIPFMAVAIGRISKRMRAISGTVQGKVADVTNVLEETVAGVRIVKSFAAEQHEISRFTKTNDSALRAIIKAARKNAQLRPITEFIGAFAIALMLFMGGNIVASTIATQQKEHKAWMQSHPGATDGQAPKPTKPPGGLTPGDLIAFFFLLNAVVQSASDIGSIANTRAQMLAAARRIFDEVLDVESEVQERPDATVLPEISGNVRFENVSFKYCEDCPDVLKNVSFEVRPGEVVALVGRSGAGKSTLVDLIPRFYDPTEGRILIDGIDLRDVQLESLRQQIGIVPQETWLFAGTLRDNIAYGKRDATDDAVKSAAYAANASFIEGMEKKIDTVVGERGISLSGGERQRIAIARAILMNPRLLILDEATSSLDASSEALVQEALDELMKRRTTIVIAHRLSTIINANRILAMENGRIVEMGSHSELMAAGGYYARLYETQLRGFE